MVIVDFDIKCDYCKMQVRAMINLMEGNISHLYSNATKTQWKVVFSQLMFPDQRKS